MTKIYHFLDFSNQKHDLQFNLEHALLSLFPFDKIKKLFRLSINKTNKYAYFEVEVARCEFHLIENINLSHLNLGSHLDYPKITSVKLAKNTQELAQYIDFFGDDYVKSEINAEKYHEIYIKTYAVRYTMPNKNIGAWAKILENV